jgi:hypothetical protein
MRTPQSEKVICRYESTVHVPGTVLYVPDMMIGFVSLLLTSTVCGSESQVLFSAHQNNNGRAGLLIKASTCSLPVPGNTSMIATPTD